MAEWVDGAVLGGMMAFMAFVAGNWCLSNAWRAPPRARIPLGAGAAASYGVAGFLVAVVAYGISGGLVHA